MRTISYLSTLNGRVYVYLADPETGTRFLKEAEKEGFSFGDGVKPTDRHYSELMAVNHDKTINYVGVIGHIAFGSGAETVNSEHLIRIDYKNYLSGMEDYFIKKD